MKILFVVVVLICCEIVLRKLCYLLEEWLKRFDDSGIELKENEKNGWQFFVKRLFDLLRLVIFAAVVWFVAVSFFIFIFALIQME